MTKQQAFPTTFPVLDLGHYELRQWRMEDAEPYLSWRAEPAVFKYFGDPLLKVEQVRDRIDIYLDQFTSQKGIFWSIVEKQTNRNIGACQYSDWDQDHRKAAIGYLLNQAYWNRGIITQAIRAVATYGFERTTLNRIEAFVSLENPGSRRVLEKVGFQLEGVLRDYEYFVDGYEDFAVYAVLRKGWTNNLGKRP